MNLDQTQAITLFGVCLVTIVFLLGVVVGMFLTYVYYEHMIVNNFYQEGDQESPYYKQTIEIPVFDDQIGQSGK